MKARKETTTTDKEIAIQVSALGGAVNRVPHPGQSGMAVMWDRPVATIRAIPAFSIEPAVLRWWRNEG